MENSQRFQGAKAKIYVGNKMSSTEVKTVLRTTAAVNQSWENLKLVSNLQSLIENQRSNYLYKQEVCILYIYTSVCKCMLQL